MAGEDFGKSLTIGLVVGVVCVIVGGGLILFLALYWHKLTGSTPRDAAYQNEWDAESGRHLNSSQVSHSRNVSGGSFRSFFSNSSRSSNEPYTDEKRSQKWFGSRRSDSINSNNAQNKETNVSRSSTPPDSPRSSIPRAVIR